MGSCSPRMCTQLSSRRPLRRLFRRMHSSRRTTETRYGRSYSCRLKSRRDVSRGRVRGWGFSRYREMWSRVLNRLLETRWRRILSRFKLAHFISMNILTLNLKGRPKDPLFRAIIFGSQKTWNETYHWKTRLKTYDHSRGHFLRTQILKMISR